MEWIERLRGAVVGLDTAPLIYFIEEHPDYLPLVQPFFEAADQGSFQIVTSVLTLTEVLVHPLRAGNHNLADQYRSILLHARHIVTLPISDAVAERAAELRAQFGVRTPDAIQLAAAAHSGAAYFVTNDSRLPGLPNVEILVLDDVRRRAEGRGTSK